MNMNSLIPKNKKLITITIIVIVGLAGFNIFKRFSPFMGDRSKSAVTVEVKQVEVSTVIEEIDSVGTLSSDESVIIRPEVAGRITKVNFTEGQKIEKDQIILEIDSSIYRAELAKTKATYEISKLNYKRSTELQKKGATSEQARDEAFARLKENEAAVELAEARLDKTTIKAPFAGVIGLRSVSSGDYLDTGREISHLESVDKMKVEFSIPEKYLAKISIGQDINAKFDAYKDKVFHGTVFAIDPKIDPDTRNIRIKAIISNKEYMLRPGMFAFVNLIVEKRDNSILVPEESLIPKGKDLSVFKVVDSKAVFTPVVIGQRKNAKAEIVQGLKAGDSIITAGHMKVRDGADIIVAGEQKPEGKKP